ncbi:flagellar hook assembly protein FlgD [Geothermobacter hydrogeniphilus]|uniref:Basal-body rod modification protein FlgD n=1 Tax=Geothermobacter hydrogeniphilus TaxID=1969733 RepID=A0A1X0YEI5_9BACT|nr:flagellar hook assembly protein FlgD [Geothermobacter hydrogeniphilus]ORJ63519.1 hypothetical protein B5V00_01240 [Geothermobacter hydrogeniphilus]
MATINGIGSQANLAAATGNIASQALGKEDFLQLLVAQLQNQDPLNPADATEFTAQLAQFSSLEQMFTMNESLQKLSSLSGDMERLSALGLIGREVTAQTDLLKFEGAPIELGYRLPDSAARVTVHILDANNNTVATLAPPSKLAGEHFLSWDGTADNGVTVPKGSYRLAVNALDSEDRTIETVPLVRGTVSGVDLDPSGSSVVTGNGSFLMSKLLNVNGGSP